jgi:trimeric autotransporter adhesin
LMAMGIVTPVNAQYVSGTGATSNVVGTSTTSSVSAATAVGSITIGGGTAAADKATVTANSLDAIAIGAGAAATGTNAMAIGGTTSATSITVTGGQIIPAIVLGYNSTATATNTANGILDRATGAGNIATAVSANAAGLTPAGIALGNANTVTAGGLAVGDTNKVNAAGVATAVGFENNVSGTYAVGVGYSNTISAISATAIGTANIASGNTAIAIGRQNTASGAFSFALGNVAKATGVEAVAIGHSVQASANGAIALGGSIAVETTSATIADATATKASGANSISIGQSSVASAANATVLGSGGTGTAATATTASGIGATAIGGNATAGANAAAADAIAIGGQSVASSTDAVAIGRAAIAGGAAGTLNQTAVGNAASATGDSGSAFGNGSNASGRFSTAIGLNAAATGGTSTAVGVNASASSSNSTAMGILAHANGSASGTAIGDSANADGTYSTALGVSTVATGNFATAVGVNARATGAGSFAAGGNSGATGAQASAADSIAIGGQSVASSAGAVAIGLQAQAVGGKAVSIGVANKAFGNGAVAIGDPNYASGTGAFAAGADNIANSDGTTTATALNAANGAVAIGNANTAIGQGSVAIGNSTTVSVAGGIAIGDTAKASATKGVALGSGATATNANDVALGASSVTTAPHTGTFVLYGGSASGTPAAGVVSVGVSGGERQITNVAPGVISATSTDAINGSQLASVQKGVDALGNSAASALGGTVAYDPATGKLSAPSFPVAGVAQTSVGAAIAALQTSAPVQYTTAAGSVTPNGLVPSNTMTLVGTGAGNATPVTLSNVAAGSLLATSTDAVNGSQINTLGTSVATAIGGTSSYSATTGQVTTGLTLPSTGGTTYNSVQTALNAVGAGWNLTTTNTGTGTVSGTTVHNVSPSGTVTVTAGDNIAVTQAGSTLTVATSMTPVFTSVGVTGGPTISATGLDMGSTKISNLAAGTAGTDAVNVSQLNAATGSSKYFVANSTGSAPTATGTGSIALGPNAVATNNNDVALGAGSKTAVHNTGAFSLNGGSVAATAPASVVSVGTAGNERQVQNVAAGVLSATSTDAVNGSQLFAVGTAVNNLGAGTVAALGGGASVAPDGTVTAPSYAVGSGTYNNVGSALAALQTGAPVQYSTSGAPTTANGLVPSQNMTLVGAAAGPVTLDNVAPGSTLAGSTQAINGGQLNTGLASVAANLGGGSTYDPTTGTVTAPSYVIGSTTYNDVGNALGALDKSVNGGAGIKYFHANSTLSDSAAAGTDSVAIGPLASATAAGSVALGANAVANRGAVTAVADPLSLTGGAVTTTTGEVSVGSAGAARQITNVAAGTQATDAVNVGQITPIIAAQAQLGTTTAAALGAGASFDPATGKISQPAYVVGTTTYTDVGAALAGLQSGAPVQYSASGSPTTPNGLVPSQNLTLVGAAAGPVTLDNVAAGIIASGSTQAINGGQIYANQASVAAGLGGGAKVNTDGTISAPSYTVGGSAYTNVGAAVAALDSGLTGVQTSIASLPITANNTSNLALPAATGTDATAVGFGATATGANSVALGAGSTDGGQANVVSVGAAGAERKIVNVAAGTVSSASTDAINGRQLYGTANSVAAALGGGSTVNPDGTVSAPSYAAGGTAYNNVGGAITALDTGLANVSASVANLPIKGNNTSGLANPVATGADATAVGFGANATGANSVALGAGSTDGGQANVVSVGAAGAERKLVNVAAGTLSAISTDAVNGSQLNVTNQQLASLGHSAVQYATTPAGSTTSTINLSSDAGGPVIIHNLAPGVAATDAANVSQVQAVAAVASNGVQYDKNADGSKANTVTLSGGTAGTPVGLRNVAAGVNATDAVNVAQLQGSAAGTLSSAKAYTDQSVSNLKAFAEQGLRDAKQLATSGTALALAGTGLRYDDRAGKTSIAGAMSFYQGTTGIAFGIGHTSANQAWRYNLSVNGTPWAEKAEVGVVVGVSYSFQ